MPVKNTNEPLEVPKEAGITRKAMFISLVLIAIVAFILGGLAGANIATTFNNPFGLQNTRTIENIFTDLNGDGLPDYIVYAEVIFNESNSNFMLGQQ